MVSLFSNFLGLTTTAILSLLLIAAVNPAVANTLSLSQAILKTLDSSPLVKIQKTEIQSHEGLLQRASGQFDWVAFNKLDYRQNVPAPTIEHRFDEDLRERSANYVVGIRKQLRNGISLKPTVSAHYYDSDNGDEDDQVYGNMGLEVVIPLLRGLGREVNQAFVSAKRENFNTAVYLARYRIAQQIQATATAYWECLLATRKVALLAEVVSNSNKKVEQLQRFVAAGEAGQASVGAAIRKLLDQETSLIKGRLALLRCRQRLGLAMGTGTAAHNLAHILDDEFPPIPETDIFEPMITDAALKDLIDNRGDYRAAAAALEAEKILLTRARDDMRPRLDLTLQAGFPNMLAGVHLVYPLGKNVASGDYVHRRARANMAELRQTELAGRIGGEIRLAVETLRGLIAEGILARKAVEIHREELNNLQNRVDAGEAAARQMVDLLEGYYRAKIAELQVRQQYAAALAVFSLATGGLLEMDPDQYRFKMNSLLEVPDLEGITRLTYSK